MVVKGAFLLGIALICPDEGHITIEKMVMDTPVPHEVCMELENDKTMNMAFINQLDLPEGCTREFLCVNVQWEIKRTRKP